jgi:hypothetical protein
MTVKILTGTYSAGYTLAAGYSGLVLDSTAVVGGAGVTVGFNASVVNYGAIHATAAHADGVSLAAGGAVTNGSATATASLVEGYYAGISISGGPATIVNFGAIRSTFDQKVGGGAGVVLGAGGGTVTNGAATDTSAVITGDYFGTAGIIDKYAAITVTNFGRIGGGASGNAGLYLKLGGRVTNGSTADATATIYAITIAGVATVSNLGTLRGANLSARSVNLVAGGALTNGSASDTQALIEGYAVAGAAGVALTTIANYGTVLGGVIASGTLINGSATDLGATITGLYDAGVQLSGGLIENFATITGVVSAINMKSLSTPGGAVKGTLVNGSVIDTTALIEGSIVMSSGKIANYATIGNVFMSKGGLVLNGSAVDTIASMSYIYAVSSPTVTNFGTLTSGIVLYTGRLTNGATNDSAALIERAGEGVRAMANATTVTNFGTIASTNGGLALVFGSAQDRLIAEAGCTFVGEVQGGGGVLELATGKGTIVGLGVTGTVSGAETLVFSRFGSYVLDKRTSWTLAGTNMVDGGDSLTVAGSVTQTGAVTIGDTTTSAGSLSIASGAVWTLSGAVGIAEGTATTSSLGVAGTLKKSGAAGVSVIAVATNDTGLIQASAGTLDFSSKLTGTGALKINGGATLELDASVASTLSVAFNGASATLALTSPTTFAATISGFAVTDTVDLLKITATGASVNAGDQLVIVNGSTTVATLQLTGSYAGATFTVGSDGHGGTDVTLLTTAGASSSTVPVLSSQRLITAMASLGATPASATVSASRTEGWTPTLLEPGPRTA